MKLLTLASIALLCGPAIASPPQSPANQSPETNVEGSWDAELDPALPNVLILGDSISMGYTGPVREKLAGEANVVRPMRADHPRPENCGDTTRGLANIDRWLGDVEWDVIHFNWGLWDLCYRHPDSPDHGNRDKENGTVSTTPEDYEAHLETLVERLKQTGATLIWANTTLVPEGEPGRFVGDDVKYNAIAARVMERHDIAINDLHALTAGFPADHFIGPGDVHFTDKGTARLTDQVAAKIRATIRIEKP